MVNGLYLYTPSQPLNVLHYVFQQAEYSPLYLCHAAQSHEYRCSSASTQTMPTIPCPGIRADSSQLVKASSFIWKMFLVLKWMAHHVSALLTRQKCQLSFYCIFSATWSGDQFYIGDKNGTSANSHSELLNKELQTTTVVCANQLTFNKQDCSGKHHNTWTYPFYTKYNHTRCPK